MRVPIRAGVAVPPQKRNRVNETEQPQDDEAGQPIRVAAVEKPSEKLLIVHHRRRMRLANAVQGLAEGDANFVRSFSKRGSLRIGSQTGSSLRVGTLIPLGEESECSINDSAESESPSVA